MGPGRRLTPSPAELGRRRRRGGGGGGGRRAGGHRRGDRRVLMWDATARPGTARPRWPRSTSGCGRWRCWPDGRVVTGGPTGGCWCRTQPGRGTAPAELGRHDDGAVSAVAVLARRAGGHRRGRQAGADVGSGPVGLRAGELGRQHDRAVRAVAVLPDGRVVTGGRRRLGAGVGPGHDRAPTQPSWAASDRTVLRWRCCPTGGGSPAGTTGGCWCGTRPDRAPAQLEWAATAVRCCGGGAARRAGASGGGHDGRVLGWDPDRPGLGPAGGARLPGRGGRGGGAGRRADSHRRGRPASADLGPGPPGSDPAGAGPPHGLGEGDSSDGRRAGSHRRGTTGKCWYWDPARPGSATGRARRPRRAP